MNIDSYSDDGVWIKIPFYEIMTEGAEETFEKLVQFTHGMDMVEQYDSEEDVCKYAQFR